MHNSFSWSATRKSCPSQSLQSSSLPLRSLYSVQMSCKTTPNHWFEFNKWRPRLAFLVLNMFCLGTCTCYSSCQHYIRCVVHYACTSSHRVVSSVHACTELIRTGTSYSITDFFCLLLCLWFACFFFEFIIKGAYSLSVLLCITQTWSNTNIFLICVIPFRLIAICM